MDAKLKTILKNLPAKKPRSRLEPYRELIRKMRRRHRSYREIIQVLLDECDLQISVSTLHDFVRVRSNSQRTTPANRNVSVSNKNSKERKQSVGANKGIQVQTGAQRKEKEREDHRSTNADLPINRLTKRTLFHYNPEEPLRLTSKQLEKKNRS